MVDVGAVIVSITAVVAFLFVYFTDVVAGGTLILSITADFVGLIVAAPASVDIAGVVLIVSIIDA